MQWMRAYTIATTGGGRIEKQYLLDKVDFYTGGDNLGTRRYTPQRFGPKERGESAAA
jgi:hypothetical protein